jgi:hypothetical protein
MPAGATGLPSHAGPTHGSSSGHASSSDAVGDSDGVGPAAKRLRVGADEQTAAAASRGPVESSALPPYSSAPQVAAPSQLTLSICEADGAMVAFKLQPSTRLSTLFQAYCTRRGLQREGVRFIRDGRALHEDSPGFSATVHDNGLEDGDVIDVHLVMTGD